MLINFLTWLAATPLSVSIRESTWVFPIVESVHVLGLCLFVGLAVMLDLRLLGLTLRSVPASDVYRKLSPWTWAGAAIMVASGILTFFNDPVRYYQNVFFRVKVVMLVLAVLNAYVFQVGVFRSIRDWDAAAVTPRKARLAGYLSLTLWAGIVVAGRMIAYNWFDKK